MNTRSWQKGQLLIETLNWRFLYDSDDESLREIRTRVPWNGRLQTRTSKVQIRFHFISIIDPQFENWNVKYLLSFLLFREDSSLLDEDNCHASLPVKVFNSQKICILQFKVSGWLTREDFTSPKRKIKKFKILHKRNYIKSTNGKYPKLWWIWKMGHFQTLSRKLKKMSITEFTRVDFKLWNPRNFSNFYPGIFPNYDTQFDFITSKIYAFSEKSLKTTI